MRSSLLLCLDSPSSINTASYTRSWSCHLHRFQGYTSYTGYTIPVLHTVRMTSYRPDLPTRKHAPDCRYKGVAFNIKGRIHDWHVSKVSKWYISTTLSIAGMGSLTLNSLNINLSAWHRRKDIDRWGEVLLDMYFDNDSVLFRSRRQPLDDIGHDMGRRWEGANRLFLRCYSAIAP